MTRQERTLLFILILNALVTLLYLIWNLVPGKEDEDEDEREQEREPKDKARYLVSAGVMLLCPVVGILYFLLSYLKYRYAKLGERDLSDVEFSKKRQPARIKADENRERNIVSVEEAILVSDPEKKRANMLNILLGDTEEAFAAIAQALNSDDSEVAHYAASFLQSKMDTFREYVRKAQWEIEGEEITDEGCQSKIIDLIHYMNQMLKQNVFMRIEQEDYVEQMEQLCEQLFQNARHRMLPECYESAIGRMLDLEHYDRAELWGERFFAQYPDLLPAYTLRMKMYFETGKKEQFFETLDQLRASPVVIDSQTLELIRMIQR